MADEKDILYFQIKKLITDNSLPWSNDLEVLLKGKGIWKYIINATMKDTASTETGGVKRVTDAEDGKMMEKAVLSESKTQKMEFALTCVLMSPNAA